MVDRSSRPQRCPRRLERQIVTRRFTRRWRPHRLAYHLHVPRSTVGRILARFQMPLLAHPDQATGLPLRAPRPVRYEADRPGQLVRVDIQKLGRIPDGGGWRAFGRGSAQDRRAAAATDRAARAGADPSRGYTYLHHAVDDHSRLACSQILDDERKENTAIRCSSDDDSFSDGLGRARSVPAGPQRRRRPGR